MFGFIGNDIFNGILNSIKKSPEKIGDAFEAIISGVKNVPGLNIPPLLWNILQDVPERWNQLPEETKQAFFQALIAAATKAMAAYSKD